MPDSTKAFGSGPFVVMAGAVNYIEKSPQARMVMFVNLIIVIATQTCPHLLLMFSAARVYLVVVNTYTLTYTHTNCCARTNPSKRLHKKIAMSAYKCYPPKINKNLSHKLHTDIMMHTY